MAGKQAFIQTIHKIGEPYLAQGYVSTQKGQVLKGNAMSGTFEYQIKFQPIESNPKEYTTLSCTIVILSEQLREWRFKKYRSKDIATSTVFIANLKEIIPVQPKLFTWEIKDKKQEEFALSITTFLEEYVNPIFSLFEDTQDVVNHVIDNGWRLNEYMSSGDFVFPIDFMCCFASKSEVQRAFNNYVKREGLSSQVKRVYKEMSSPKYKGFIESNSANDKVFQLAYLNGIQLV